MHTPNFSTTVEINSQRDNRMYYSDWDLELAQLELHQRGAVSIFGWDFGSVLGLHHPYMGARLSPQRLRPADPNPSRMHQPHQQAPPQVSESQLPQTQPSQTQSETYPEERGNPIVSAFLNCTSIFHNGAHHQRQRARPIPMLGMHEAQPRRFGRVMGNLPPEMMYFMA